MASAIQSAVQRWDIQPNIDPFAILLEIDQFLDFASLTKLAQGIRGYTQTIAMNRPVIIIIKRDYAQSLGQSLRAMHESHPLLVIDQVGLEEGDYIDIGSPLLDGRVVPLTVKTLIFYHS